MNLFKSEYYPLVEESQKLIETMKIAAGKLDENE